MQQNLTHVMIPKIRFTSNHPLSSGWRGNGFVRFCQFVGSGVIFCFLVGSLYARDAILIEAKINDQPVHLVFDTGSEAIMLYRQSAQRLHVGIIDPDPDKKPELGMALMGKTTPVKFEALGNAGQAILRVLDLPPVSELKSEDGVLSWFVLKGNLLKIDANEHKISFLNELPTGIDEWNKIPIKMDSYTLILKTPGDGVKSGIISVDTGSSSGVALSKTNWEKWKKENPDAKSTLIGYYMPGAGPILTEVMWAKELKVGPIKLTNVLVREANIAEIANAGDSGFEMNLSMDGLKSLDFIVDGKNGFAYFSPIRHDGSEINYNRAGVLFMPLNMDSNDLIAHVMQNSPASEAGIQNGDILLAINSQDVNHWKETDGFSVLAEQPAGTKIALTLKRGDKQFETVVTLWDILGSNAAKP